MNTKNSFRVSAFAASAALFAVGATLPQSASAAAYLKLGDVKFGVESTSSAFRGGVNVATGDVNNDVHYVGRDGNWFNPSNWSSGRVPGEGDNVILDGDDYVLIDSAQGAGAPVGGGRGKPTFSDLSVHDDAVLEVIGGAILETRTQILGDRGQIIFRGSGSAGGDLIVAGESAANACTECTLVLNPTQQNKRIVVLQSSVTVDVGLGGTTPASLVQDAAGGSQLAAGPGHYSTTTADTMVVEGDLKLSTYYGFEPRPGDSFQIMTINGRRSGEFIGLPEGGYVGCTDQNVGMRISYMGGDGNDIVISAEQTEPGICLLLPAVQKVREAAARLNVQARIDKLPLAAAVEEGVTQTREHILLARQTQLTLAPVDEGTNTKMPTPTIPISGPKPTPK